MMLEPWAQTLPSSLYMLIREGYLAVSMFFILSGFVLTRSYGETDWTRKSLRRYALARFARVYPVYLLSLLILEPFIAGSTAPGKPWLIANYFLLLQGWTSSIPVHWNTPAWSLSCEILFYLCFPPLVVVLNRTSHRAVGIMTALICLLPALLWILGVPDSYKPLIHLADFAIGITASRIYDLLGESRPSLAGRGYWFYVPGMLLALLLLLRPFYLPGVLDLNGLLRPLVATTLVGLAFGGGAVVRVFSSRIAVYLGKTSYAIYILHIPLLWTFKRWWPFWFPGMSGAVSAICYVLIVVAVSAVVYRYLEEPANRYLRAWPDREKAREQVSFSGDALPSV
jgi:peptidoglycan/LPS O-acetylase OafA/YrhL